MTQRLSEPFFARGADVVDPALLGCSPVGQGVVLRIIETQALAAELSWSGAPLGRWVRGTLGGLRPGERVAGGLRVGIDYASTRDRDRPWRFQLEGVS